jgi:hypothetical protein
MPPIHLKPQISLGIKRAPPRIHGLLDGENCGIIFAQRLWAAILARDMAESDCGFCLFYF